jgi:hypothetical protein
MVFNPFQVDLERANASFVSLTMLKTPVELTEAPKHSYSRGSALLMNEKPTTITAITEESMRTCEKL